METIIAVLFMLAKTRNDLNVSVETGKLLYQYNGMPCSTIEKKWSRSACTNREWSARCAVK